MEDGSVAVHEGHCRGKVEERGGKDEDVVAQVVGLADHKAVDVEMKSRRMKHDHTVEGGGQGEGQQQEEEADLHRTI